MWWALTIEINPQFEIYLNSIEISFSQIHCHEEFMAAITPQWPVRQKKSTRVDCNVAKPHFCRLLNPAPGRKYWNFTHNTHIPHPLAHIHMQNESLMNLTALVSTFYVIETHCWAHFHSKPTVNVKANANAKTVACLDTREKNQTHQKSKNIHWVPKTYIFSSFLAHSSIHPHSWFSNIRHHNEQLIRKSELDQIEAFDSKASDWKCNE